MPKGWVFPRGTLWCSNGRLGCWAKKEQMAQQARFIIFLQQRYFAFSLIVETSGTWVLVVVLGGGHIKQTRGPNLEDTHIVNIYRERVSRTLILIKNAASPKMVSFSLSPQNTDSPTHVFSKHLLFFFFVFLNANQAWLRGSSDTTHHPQDTLVNPRALLYTLMTLDPQD